MCRDAARRENLECLRYVQELGCPWDGTREGFSSSGLCVPGDHHQGELARAVVD
jgi:hypothetical protein